VRWLKKTPRACLLRARGVASWWWGDFHKNFVKIVLAEKGRVSFSTPQGRHAAELT
jgi:hypothetical protein